MLKASDALDQLIRYRKAQWTQHCCYVLEHLLLPIAPYIHSTPTEKCERGILLIDNRINDQWLFTVLNSWLMAPKDCIITIICDSNSVQAARSLLHQNAANIPAVIKTVEEISPGTNLCQPASFNAMMKQPLFWKQLDEEEILVIQTDALLAKPLHPFFFNFSYLGAPFLPRQHSEYFSLRNDQGQIVRFFKSDSPIHGSPDSDVYPHLHGNGGLSIRSKTAMQTICERWGPSSQYKEAEDVFFSRHISKISSPAPLEIAQAFATVTTYNPNAVGSHACWKFLDGANLAHHFEQHLREAWAMTTALRNQAN